MFWNFILKLFLFLFLALAQLSLAGGLPSGAREINFLIIFMIFFLEIDSSLKTVWWFVAIGFIFGLYYSTFFSLFLILWPLVFLFCRSFYLNILTNRSLYSFVSLTIFTTVFYYGFFNLLVYASGLFFDDKADLFLLASDFWFSMFWGLAINLLAALIIFYIAGLATNRLKPFFIFRKK